MNIPMNAKAFCLCGKFYDWDTGALLPDDFKGYVVNYGNVKINANAPVFETALNEQGERVWIFVDWISN